jgi:uncharacterized coiled-coil protein SlyX
MAYEALEPVRNIILAKREKGPNQLTLAQLTELLKTQYNIVTTPGTLSRYLKDTAAPELGLRPTTAAEEKQVETAILQIELLAEVRGRLEEQRAAIEYLGGQLRVLTETIEDTQISASKTPGPVAPSPAIIRQIWIRAFLLSVLLVGIVAAGVLGVIVYH